MNIIHLSDLHIGKSNNREKSALVVDWILKNKDKHQSELVIISGDLVDDGKAWQFDQAKELLECLRENGFLVLVCPGNHDYGPEGVRESHRSQANFFSLISGVKEYPHLQIISGQAFILLDSMAEEIKNIEIWGAQGNLGEEQLQKLDQMLEDLAENPEVENVFVILHFNDPKENKEELFGIDLIYASGQTVERDQEGKMVIPVINVNEKTITRYLIH